MNIPSFCVLPIPWWQMEIDPIGMTMWVAVGGGGGRWRFGRSVGCCRWETLPGTCKLSSDFVLIEHVIFPC